MAKLSWTQPCCERCWFDREGEWGEMDDGSGAEYLIGVRVPVMVKKENPEIERCSFCGSPTIVGIYVRHDPNNVPYPAEEDD